MIFFKRKKKTREELMNDVMSIVESLDMMPIYNTLTAYNLTEINNIYAAFLRSKERKKITKFSYWLAGYLLGYYRGAGFFEIVSGGRKKQ